MNNTMNLTVSEWSSIVNGLRCAADKYGSIATELRAHDQTIWAEQFDRQEQEARRLAYRITEEVGA